MAIPSAAWPINTVTLGDSQTYGNLAPEVSWRLGLATLTGSTNRNASANGRTVSDLLSNYDAEVYPYAPYLTGSPTLAILNIGTNDLFSVDADTAFASKQTLLQKLRGDGFYVVDCTISGANNQPVDGEWNLRRIDYNAMTLANASGLADFVWDIDTLIGDPVDSPYVFPDDVHYTEAGNTLIANDGAEVIAAEFNWP